MALWRISSDMSVAWSIRVVGRGCLAFEDGDVVDSAMVSLEWKIGMGREREAPKITQKLR